MEVSLSACDDYLRKMVIYYLRNIIQNGYQILKNILSRGRSNICKNVLFRNHQSDSNRFCGKCHKKVLSFSRHGETYRNRIQKLLLKMHLNLTKTIEQC